MGVRALVKTAENKLLQIGFEKGKSNPIWSLGLKRHP
jgi:hypothetical protein